LAEKQQLLWMNKQQQPQQQHCQIDTQAWDKDKDTSSTLEFEQEHHELATKLQGSSRGKGLL